MVRPELLFLIYKWVFLALDSSAKRLRGELTLLQHGCINSPVGPEVAPPSVFYGHNFIEVRNTTEAVRRIGIYLLQPGEAG